MIGRHWLLALAVISVISSGDFLTIDNLFIITVSLVMALMFGLPVLFEMYSRGKLPIPFVKRPDVPAQAAISGAAPSRGAKSAPQVKAPTTPPLLDAKGRAVPPDVKAMMNRMTPTEAKDA